MGKPKTSDAAVGNYIVNVDAVANTAVPSIDPLITTATTATTATSSSKDIIDVDNGRKGKLELIVIDEVGKMELKCPSFLPAVVRALDAANNNNNNADDDNDKNTRMVLGTLPTPRYGRVIESIENIRARKDVLVVHVTKTNRDELKNVVFKAVSDASSIEQEKDDNSWTDALQPYLYTRGIGASSMDKKNTRSTKQKNNTANKKASSSSRANTRLNMEEKVAIWKKELMMHHV